VLVAASLLLAVFGTAAADQLDDARAAYGGGDYATAFRLVRTLAEQGNAAAQDFLGSMYETGKGVPQDKAEATKWHQIAADQGYAPAEFKVGEMYYNGRAIDVALQPGDYDWIEKGLGVPRYYAKAVMWWGRAAANGYPPAQSQLGFMYANGMGVPLDHRESARWQRRAAEQGYEHSGLVVEDRAQFMSWNPIRIRTVPLTSPFTANDESLVAVRGYFWGYNLCSSRNTVVESVC
jgi:TPR repeat protein